MNLFLELLTEIIPRFRTEKCAFIADDVEQMLIVVGRVQDLDEEVKYEYTMDISSLGWLFFRFFIRMKWDTIEEVK